MSISDGTLNLGSANETSGSFHWDTSTGMVGRLIVGLFRIRNSSLAAYGVYLDWMVAVSWHLICFVDSPIPATSMSTFFRRRFRVFASFFVMKLHMDAESSRALAGYFFPFWPRTSSATVSRSTVLRCDWTDKLTWDSGFDVLGVGSTDVDVDWIGCWDGFFGAAWVDDIFGGASRCNRVWCFSWQTWHVNLDKQFRDWCPDRKQFQQRRFWYTKSWRCWMDFLANTGHSNKRWDSEQARHCGLLLYVLDATALDTTLNGFFWNGWGLVPATLDGCCCSEVSRTDSSILNRWYRKSVSIAYVTTSSLLVCSSQARSDLESSL
uniref:(northern house mosquito) hypothetical protein n=1 Tax=Culex pipiens TaxID=7175 RepID=A0A8D8BER3_CULPI